MGEKEMFESLKISNKLHSASLNPSCPGGPNINFVINQQSAPKADNHEGRTDQ